MKLKPTAVIDLSLLLSNIQRGQGKDKPCEKRTRPVPQLNYDCLSSVNFATLAYRHSYESSGDFLAPTPTLLYKALFAGTVRYCPFSAWKVRQGRVIFFRYIGVSGSATLTPGRNLRKSWNLASQLRSSEQCKKAEAKTSTLSSFHPVSDPNDIFFYFVRESCGISCQQQRKLRKVAFPDKSCLTNQKLREKLPASCV